MGLGLWVALAPIYNPIVATGAEILIQFAEHPNVTSIETLGRDAVIHRAGFDPRSSLPQIAISDLTFNFVVLLALFGFAGFERKGQRDLILLVAFTLLFSGQVLGVVAKIMSIFVLNLGEWSKVHYSPFERNFWATAYHFYRFVGGYAIAFVIW